MAEEWQKMTELPFVFAAWVSNKQLPPDFIAQFNKAASLGVNQLEKVVDSQANISISRNELLEYFTNYISYDLDEEKKKGLKKFLTFLSE